MSCFRMALWLMTMLGIAAMAQASPQAVEIGAGNVKDLPGGREADGIIGDFVLRNDQIEAVVSGNLHERRANMGTLWDAPTPGCIYDLTLRGTNNDQLTLWAPGGQKGQLSLVRIIKDGQDGEAIIRAEISSTAATDGVGRRHDYILRDGWQYVVAVSTYENRSDKPAKVHAAANWTGLENQVKVGDLVTGLCQDPDDRVGYAWGPIAWPDTKPAKGEVALGPGESGSFATALAVGAGSAEACGIIRNFATPSRKVFVGQVVDGEGKPASGAALQFTVAGADSPLTQYVDAEGRYRLTLLEPKHQVTIVDLGRDKATTQLKSGAAQLVTLPPRSGVQLEVKDDRDSPLPCKVQFFGMDGTADPNLGPMIRAHGCDNQYHSENGRFFQPLPAGKYRVVITHGVEFDHVVQEITVEQGKTAHVRAVLKRVLDTTGWVSTDFHNHTTESGDNFCGTPDRVINLAAEQIEFAPTTEHNRISSWQPHIERLGLTRELKTVSGIELTGNGPHLNAFPLTIEPRRQDGGAPVWDPDPRVNAIKLRNMPGDVAGRWVQLNHPSLERYFNDVDGDKKADGGYRGLLQYIDAAEVYGQFILSSQRYYEQEFRGKIIRPGNRPMLWMQMLNAGQRVWTVATTDSHDIARGGVGGWRTYVASSHDAPAEINPNEIIANSKLGNSFVTTGPFLQVATSDGHGPGSTIAGASQIVLKVRVQCNTWTDVDRVCVLVNGRPRPDLDFRKTEHPEMFTAKTVRFEREIPIQLTSDAHLIVVAIGEASTLGIAYGHGWQSTLHPIAYHNPIYVDVNGNGFEPNHDTLGSPYLDYGFVGNTNR